MQLTQFNIIIACGRKLETLEGQNLEEVIETDEELQIIIAAFLYIGKLMQAEGFITSALEQLEDPAYLSELQRVVNKYLQQ